MILLVTTVFLIPYEHCKVRPPNADVGDNLRISANVLNKQSEVFQLKDCAGVENKQGTVNNEIYDDNNQKKTAGQNSL
jgi:hypothetical protein